MAAKSTRSGTIKKTITVGVPQKKAWKKISNIADLSSWVTGVKNTAYLSKKKTGIGAIRVITFENKNKVEEHVVAWEHGRCFTYVATEGLPLRAYVAAISLNARGYSVQVTWKSYLSSNTMTARQFLEFQNEMGSFYESSLKNLKRLLESKNQVINMK